MCKKALYSLLIVGFIVGLLAIPAAALAASSDVSTAALSSGATTRAEFAMLAVEGLNLSPVTPATPTYSDVSPGDSYYEYVEGATAEALMRGLGDGSFAPDLEISRQQVATILARYLASIELQKTGYITGTDGTQYASLNAWYAADGEAQLASFTDRANILAVHRAGVAYLTMRDIITNSTGWFIPAAIVTESQCVTLIDQAAAEAAALTSINDLPTVTGITPSSGPYNGGTTVYISGTNFTSDSVVRFGSNVAASVTVNSSTLITAVSPAGAAAGTVSVSVTTADGVSADTTADNFAYYLTDYEPTITYIDPDSGWEGTTVTIVGSNFQYGLTVYFGSTQAESIVYVSPTEIQAVAPAGISGNSVQIQVVNAYGASADTAADDFTYTYTYATPSISSISPDSGWEGDTVTIYGENFEYGSEVYFGTKQAEDVGYLSSNELQAIVPVGTDGNTVRVEVVTDYGISSNTSADGFTYAYTYSAPSISSISPDSGWEGDTVTIYGENFDYGSVQVYFGANQAEDVSYVSSNELQAIVPQGTDGNTVRVKVVTDYGVSSNTSADDFTYAYTYSAPYVSSISPDSGPSTGGTVVRIHGSNFTDSSTVYFGSDEAASMTVNSSSLITAVSPAGDPGSTVPVTVTTEYGSDSGASFSYATVSARPTVNSISPNRGTEGDTVTITGTNFDVSGLTVYFGGNAATILSSDANSITVTVPAGTAGRTVHVTVSTDGGTSASSSKSYFVYVGHYTPPFPF